MRPERLIAAGRVVFAVTSLFAVWLDPDEPIRYATVAYGVLLAYVVYAATVATLLWRVEAVPRLWPVVMHAANLACFSLFIFFTDPASPFTVYFVFALLAATLRWQVRGTMWTATIVIAVFFGFGIYFGIILDDPEFDLRGFIIRSVYLFVLAGLFGVCRHPGPANGARDVATGDVAGDGPRRDGLTGAGAARLRRVPARGADSHPGLVGDRHPVAPPGGVGSRRLDARSSVPGRRAGQRRDPRSRVHLPPRSARSYPRAGAERTAARAMGGRARRSGVRASIRPRHRGLRADAG